MGGNVPEWLHLGWQRHDVENLRSISSFSSREEQAEYIEILFSRPPRLPSDLGSSMSASHLQNTHHWQGNPASTL